MLYIFPPFYDDDDGDDDDDDDNDGDDDNPAHDDLLLMILVVMMTMMMKRCCRSRDFGVFCSCQVITGHSERRVGFGCEGESSDLVAEKTKVRLLITARVLLLVFFFIVYFPSRGTINRWPRSFNRKPRK